MSIEIKQMIIKSTIVSDKHDAPQKALAEVDLEALKKRVLKECRDLIEQSLNEQQER